MIAVVLLEASWAIPCRAGETEAGPAPPAARAAEPDRHEADSRGRRTGRAEADSRAIGHRSLAQDRLDAEGIIEAIRRASRARPDVRRFVIIGCWIVTGIFLIALAGVTLLVRHALAPDRKRLHNRRVRPS